jgi:hypothetical protein
VAPIGRFSQVKEFFANFELSCQKDDSAYRLNTTYRIQHVFPRYTSWRPRRRIRRLKGRFHPPWRCVALLQELCEALANSCAGRGGFGGASSFGPPDQVFGMRN